jgi:hypothetical protein
MLKEEYRTGNTNTDMIIMSISDILRSRFIRMIIKFIPQQVDCENRVILGVIQRVKTNLAEPERDFDSSDFLSNSTQMDIPKKYKKWKLEIFSVHKAFASEHIFGIFDRNVSPRHNNIGFNDFLMFKG